MHPASIKLVQHFRQEGLKKTSSFCRPQKSFKGRALTGSVKLKSNQKRDDEKVEGLDLTFIESSHHNNLVPFFQKDEIFLTFIPSNSRIFSTHAVLRRSLQLREVNRHRSCYIARLSHECVCAAAAVLLG